MIGQAPPSFSTATTSTNSGQVRKPLDLKDVDKLVASQSFKQITDVAQQEVQNFNAKEFFENNKTLVYIGGALLAWMLLRK